MGTSEPTNCRGRGEVVLHKTARLARPKREKGQTTGKLAAEPHDTGGGACHDMLRTQVVYNNVELAGLAEALRFSGQHHRRDGSCCAQDKEGGDASRDSCSCSNLRFHQHGASWPGTPLLKA